MYYMYGKYESVAAPCAQMPICGKGTCAESALVQVQRNKPGYAIMRVKMNVN